MAAGDDALDVFAPEDGIRHFETARHLLTEHGLRTVAEAVEDSVPDHRSLADREVEHLMHQLARAYEWIGDWPRATAAYHDLLAHARGADLVELEAQCLIRLSWIVWAESADVVEASRFAAEALGKLGASGNEGLRAEAYRQLASMTLVGSAPHEAIGHAVQAIELAHVAGAIEIEAQAYLASGWASLQAGEWDESVASLESALRLFERLTKADERAGAAARPIPAATLRPGSRPIGWSPWGGPSAGASFEVTRGNCLAAMASVEVCRGNAARAVELGSDALRVARATRDALSEIQACLYYSVALLEAGTLEAGLVMVREGVRIARLGGERGVILLALNSLATAGLTLLHLDEAKATADEAVQIAKQTGSSLQLLRALSSVCARAVLIEHWAEAASAANEAFAIRTSVTNPFTFFDFHLHREVEALLHYDQQSSARELVRLIDERTANDESQRRMRLVCLRMKAALYRWERDEAGAMRESEQALELAQSLSVPGESWQIAAELAGSYTLAGESMKAAEMLKVARKTVDALAHDISDSALRKSFRSSASALISASVG